MKRITLKNNSFNALEKAFSQWLNTLGYANRTIYNLPLHIREFLHHIENEHPNTPLKKLTTHHINTYYNQLQTRTNTRHKAGALASTSLNKHQQALKLFFQYLRQAGRITLPAIELKNEKTTQHQTQILTQQEIKQLFQATENINYKKKERHLQQRDKALLAIFYGCGLRRNEAHHLNLTDIDLEQKTIKVRKGKNYKQRLLPIHTTYIQLLEEYINNSRTKLLKDKTQQAFFVSIRSQRMGDQSFAIRLEIMRKAANIHKQLSLHTLRHSVATHLLQQGMPLEQIARFLGHSSLESTQIYTHILEQNQHPTE